MAEKLEAYRDKRDFVRTEEPAGGGPSTQVDCLYVMHMHAASHDHFDLRLEQGGVLRSWALPKGPSLEPGEKRLAVEVEDHPLEYGDFEGVIPKAEYGGGTVMLWDRGSWRRLGKAKHDKLDFELEGEKLTGHWTLVRVHGKRSSRRKNDHNWLLIKRNDGNSPSLRPNNLSVVSGRTMEQIARGGAPDTDKTDNREAMPSAPPLENAQPKPMPKRALAPQLASLVDEAPDGGAWLHEIKFDGYRLLAYLQEGKVRLFTRNGKDWTHRFPELAQTLSRLPVRSAILDGEVASFDRDGSSNFRKLQDILANRKGPSRTDQLVYQVFDVLYLDGYDLRSTPLLRRKQTLAPLLRTLAGAGHLVRYSDHILGQGKAFFEQISELGLEGMVSKKLDASYRSGRQKSWVKIKTTLQDEFVVGGFTCPSGSRSGFGSLLLGGYACGNKGLGELRYAGRVGSGFSSDQLSQLYKRLKPLVIDASPFSGQVPDQAGVQWVKPHLVVDVEFTERTQSGALRHPIYRGLREDKNSSEVVMSNTGNTHPRVTDRRETVRPARAGRSSDPVVAGVQLTHADRILYPEQGITKLDLAQYYEDVQDWILPHLVNRPLSLMRCPEGWEAECFFQKHPGSTFAKPMPRVPIRDKHGGSSDFVYVSSVTDLVTLAQFGVLELHPWGSVIFDVETPDTLVFDLDPGPGLPWSKIADAAKGLRERLNKLGLNAFLQATGGKGLHLVVPIVPQLSWGQLKDFAHAVAKAHAQDDPTSFTTNMAKAKRSGKVFLDYLRNGRGATSIARYSVRARERAPVATPLRWNELTPSARSNRYTISNIRRRLNALKHDPWEGYEQARAPITQAMRKAVGTEQS